MPFNQLAWLAAVICCRLQAKTTNATDMDAGKYVGVTYDPKRGTWKARIHFAGVERYIGR